MKLFHYLNYGLAIVLMFVGVKMLLSIHYEIATWVALVVIAGVLAVSVVASVLRPEKEVGKGEESARLPAPPD